MRPADRFGLRTGGATILVGVADTLNYGSPVPASSQSPASPLDDLGEQSPREECGVFGVWAPGEDVSKLTYYGLFALQHRGQEAAGIAVGDGDQILVFKDLGLVSQVFDEQSLDALKGHIAVGHTRYTTAARRRGRTPSPCSAWRRTARTSPWGTTAI